MKMNLQFFAVKAVHGKDLIYLMRVLGDTAQASVVPYTTEDELSMSADGDTVITKDGPVTTPGTPEIEFSKTALLFVDEGKETVDTIVDKLKKAMLNQTKVELWEVNLKRPASSGGKYKGTYYRGTLSEFNVNASAEDNVEVSYTYKVDETGKDGDVTVSETQKEVASYVFTDTTETGA